MHLQATGQHKNKAYITNPSHILQFFTHLYITHLHQHTWSLITQLLHVQNVHTEYRKYFRGFLNSRLLNFARNSRKLMHREYYHVYSMRAKSLSAPMFILRRSIS